MQRSARAADEALTEPEAEGRAPVTPPAPAPTPSAAPARRSKLPPDPLPSGHVLTDDAGRCMNCGWEFRTVDVATGPHSSLPNHQYRQGPRDAWQPIWQDPNLPPRWPNCPAIPEAPAPVEDLES